MRKLAISEATFTSIDDSLSGATVKRNLTETSVVDDGIIQSNRLILILVISFLIISANFDKKYEEEEEEEK